MNLGNTLKTLRKERGQTQVEFSEVCGITQTYLSQIEGNQKEPSLSILKTISENLDVPLPVIFFLSMTKEDVSNEKRDAFEMIGPSVNSFINGFFRVQKK